MAVSAFGWCCVPPLFADSDLCHSGYFDSGGGAGETSPAARRAIRHPLRAPDLVQQFRMAIEQLEQFHQRQGRLGLAVFVARELTEGVGGKFARADAARLLPSR